MTTWLHYWSPDTGNSRVETRARFDLLSSRLLSKARPGDVVWVFTQWRMFDEPGGTIFGRIVVDQRFRAEDTSDPRVFAGEIAVTARANTVEPLRRITVGRYELFNLELRDDFRPFSLVEPERIMGLNAVTERSAAWLKNLWQRAKDYERDLELEDLERRH